MSTSMGSGTTGGSQPTGGSTPQNGSDPQQDPDPAGGEPTKPDTAPDDSSTSDETPAKESTQQPAVKWASESYTSPEGNKYTAYEITNADGSHTTGVQKEAKDGTTSCTVSTADGDKAAECPSGMTDEPTCQVDCARLEALTGFFACASGPVGAECGQAVEGLRANPGARPDCPSNDTNAVATTAPKYGDGHVSVTGCENVDKPGGPLDYGDPTDPNGAEPADTSQIDRLLNDGVTDPTGEPEEIATGTIRLDTYGTLRDPANPPGTEDEAPAPGAPTTGDAERNPLP